MEHPSKRQKTSRVGSKITRTLPLLTTSYGPNTFTSPTRDKDQEYLQQTVSELAAGDSEHQVQDVNRSDPSGYPESPGRPRMQRRNAEPDLIPRAPQVTVTQSIVDVIIDVGTKAVAALTLTDPNVTNTVSVSDVGIVTIPPATNPTTTITTSRSSPSRIPSSVPSASGLRSTSGSQTVLSSPPSTPPPSPISSSSATPPLPTGLLPAVSALNSGRNITASIFTSTGAHTTRTGITIIDLSTVHSNHTTTTHSTTRHTTLTTSIRPSSRQSSTGGTSTTLLGTSSSGSPSPTVVSSGVSGGAAGTATSSGSGSAASTTAAGGSGGSGSSSGPSTPTVVGGVVGGVAGLTIFLLLLLVLLRWWKRKARQRDMVEQSTTGLPPSQSPGPSTSPAMAQRPSSHTPLMSALSPAFLSRWRMSAQTASSSTTVPLPPAPPQERSFQKVSGRKIDSVLTSGGDGYGESSRSKETAPGPPPVLSGTSFYRDSEGFYGGVGQPSPRPSGQMQRESGVPSVPDDGSDIIVMRPSPARTPVTSEAGFSASEFPAPPRPPGTASTPPGSARTGTPPLQPPLLLHSRDGVGRSHPSFDGSRGSRFTESV